MPEEIIQKQEELYSDPEYKEMIDAGVFYGRKKSKTHPRMRPYILGNRSGVEIINLVKTKEMLDAALAFLKEKAKSGGTILLVGTQPPAEDIKKLAADLNLPSVTNRWLGGTLTNMKVILGRLEYFKKLRDERDKGLLGRYTKRERVMIEKQLARMEEIFQGLESFTGLPDAVLIIDANLHSTALHEAIHVKVPVVAFINTDTDPDAVNYGVVGNNKSRLSIGWFLSKVRAALEEGRSMRVVAPAEPAVQNSNGG